MCVDRRIKLLTYDVYMDSLIYYRLSPSKNNKAPAMTNGHVEGEEEEGHLENGLPPYGGGDDGMIMEDDDHFDFGGDNDGYHGGKLLFAPDA